MYSTWMDGFLSAMQCFFVLSESFILMSARGLLRFTLDHMQLRGAETKELHSSCTTSVRDCAIFLTFFKDLEKWLEMTVEYLYSSVKSLPKHCN